ncbi:MAG: N-acetylmuramoyl-L-alanine amidase [Planctomycetes bacterium]|nr:N-acetylmuramoyl-L-alanine amidase [Planctomycetota bacterium]
MATFTDDVLKELLMRRAALLGLLFALPVALVSCAPAAPVEMRDPPYVRLPEPAPPQHTALMTGPAVAASQAVSKASLFPALLPIRKQLIVSTPFPWRYVVLHHSATPNGNASEFDAQHRRKGWDGLGYDFVIGNGHDSGDGEIEVGYRWRGQLQGAHAGNFVYNRYGIGICLVGNFETAAPSARQISATAELLAYLLVKFRIPPQNVTMHRTFRDTACPGKRFPFSQLVAEAQRIAAKAR